MNSYSVSNWTSVSLRILFYQHNRSLSQTPDVGEWIRGEMTISLRDGEGPLHTIGGEWDRRNLFDLLLNNWVSRSLKLYPMGPLLKQLISAIENYSQVHTLDWNLQDLVVIKYFTCACSWTSCRMWTMAVYSEAFCGDKHMKIQSELGSCTVKDKASVMLSRIYKSGTYVLQIHIFTHLMQCFCFITGIISNWMNVQKCILLTLWPRFSALHWVQGVATNLRHPVGLFMFQILVNITDHTYTGR